MQWKSKAMETPTISECIVPSTHDGGRCSNLTVLLSSMSMVKSWMFKVDMIVKTETSLFTTSMEESTNNLTSSMLMSGRENLKRVHSMTDLGFMLREISTLSPNYQSTDTLT